MPKLKENKKHKTRLKILHIFVWHSRPMRVAVIGIENYSKYARKYISVASFFVLVSRFSLEIK